MKSSNSLTPLKVLLLIIALIGVSSAPGCIRASAGWGSSSDWNEKRVEKNISIPDFTAISSSSGIEVVYTQGPANGIAHVSSTETGMKYLKVEVNRGCLTIHYENTGSRNINGPTIVTVQSPSLRDVRLTSAASLKIQGALNEQGEVQFNLSSAASADIKALKCTNLDADLSSAASIKVSTLAGNLTYEGSSASEGKFIVVEGRSVKLSTSSAADLDISLVKGGDLKASASSGAGITVDDMDCVEVSGTASSGGSIKFSGKCDHVFKTVSSGGSIKANNLSSGKVVSHDQTAYAIRSAGEAAEAGRLAAERGRLAAEQGRQAQEQARVAVEKAQKEARKAAEKARKEADKARKEAAKARKAAKDNENSADYDGRFRIP